MEVLSAKQGEDFDQAYMDFMIEEHQKDIEKYAEQADTAEDPQVRKFAEATLPDRGRLGEGAPRALAYESEWYFVDDSTVAINEEGDAGVAWADHARLDIFFQVYGPDGQTRFAEPVNVSRNPDTFSWLPRVVMTFEPDEVYMLWQEIIFSGGTHGGEIFFARSADGGKSFRTPLNLSNTIAGAGKGQRHLVHRKPGFGPRSGRQSVCRLDGI